MACTEVIEPKATQCLEHSQKAFFFFFFTLGGGGDALLESTQIRSERGLITDGGRNATQQSRHLRTGLDLEQ